MEELHITMNVQVVWLGKDSSTATWEKESSLPQHLISEYEAGIMREVCSSSHSGCGQIVHTLSSKPCVTEPARKPLQTNDQLLSEASG